MSDAIRRGIRGAVQIFATAILMSGVLSAADTSGVVDWNILKKGLISVGFGVLGGLVTFAHNWAEDNTNLPAVLKSTPSAGQNPVTQDPPQ